MRCSIGLLVLAAACGTKSNGAVANHGGTPGDTLAVALVDPNPDGEDMGWTMTLGPAEGSRFPAVSADGAKVVDLVEDAEDFSGIPIASVVFWTKAGTVGTFQLASAIRNETGDGAPDEQTEREHEVVTGANAELAETTWHPIDKVTATGEDPDTGAPNQLVIDGVTIQLSQIADKFPAPGALSDEMGGGGCGEVVGLREGFGSKELGFAVVIPDVTLGGDDCFGLPSAELALVVPLD